MDVEQFGSRTALHLCQCETMRSTGPIETAADLTGIHVVVVQLPNRLQADDRRHEQDHNQREETDLSLLE